MKKLFLGLYLLALASMVVFYFIDDAERLKDQYLVRNKQLKQYELVRKRPASWVNLNEVSKEAVWAILVSEDWKFYEHRGIDLTQLQKALTDKFKKGKKLRGASTISQQVVKNAFYSNERSYLRKLMELISTFKLEMHLEKKRILEQYLNLVELGPGIYGIQAAARHYFQKPAKQLSAREGAFLAMLLPSPKKYSISYRDKKLTPFAQKTVDSILEKLEQAGVISEAQLAQSKQELLSFETRDLMDSLDAEYIRMLQQ